MNAPDPLADQVVLLKSLEGLSATLLAAVQAVVEDREKLRAEVRQLKSDLQYLQVWQHHKGR